MAVSKHFDGDLERGQLAEGAFGQLLSAGADKWEHKRDFQCVRTGNLAVEFETSSEPNGHGRRYLSGISVTTAYWFVIQFAAERWHVLPTETVKHLARCAIRRGNEKWIGDDQRFHNALVPLRWFYEPFGAISSARPLPEELQQEEEWLNSLPTDTQASDYARTGQFTPDRDGWTR